MHTFETAIVIPLYNEESVIKNVLMEINQEYPDYKIVVVDDCSTDKSYQNASSQNIYLLKHSANLGQGAALQTGIEFAKEKGFQYVVTFDSDGQHDPKNIGPFVDALKNNKADIVLGSRFLGQTENMPTKKKYLLKASRFFTWATTGILLTDSHNGLRAINIGKFPNFEITQNRMAHASEIISIIKTLKMNYIEMPCKIRYTSYTLQKGQSMWNSINIILDYLIGSIMK
ncbi:MAG: glycosyltransferase family 2 protein [Sulfurospirillaceae bacterium]|nr:glycosyltransferase family 2 protein [Sulfurospirillaceae bacterium]